ncbi:hypothetical protein [Phascolarctobacterium sp.]
MFYRQINNNPAAPNYSTAAALMGSILPAESNANFAASIAAPIIISHTPYNFRGRATVLSENEGDLIPHGNYAYITRLSVCAAVLFYLNDNNLYAYHAPAGYIDQDFFRTCQQVLDDNNVEKIIYATPQLDTAPGSSYSQALTFLEGRFTTDKICIVDGFGQTRAGNALEGTVLADADGNLAFS